MIQTIGVNGFVEISEKLGTVPRGKINAANLTLLQNLIGI